MPPPGRTPASRALAAGATGARAQLADLVQEQRAAIGDLEEARLAVDGPREGATFVAEQLALDQGLGQRRAVERHEREGAARTVLVQGTREQLLAGAGLALDEHGQRRPRGPLERLQELLGRRVLRDEAAHRLVVPHPHAQRGVLAAQPCLLGRLHDQHVQLVEPRRLREVVVGAQPHGLERARDLGMAGQDQHLDRECLGADLAQDLQATAVGQVQVQEHDVEAVVPQLLACIRDRKDPRHVVPSRAQLLLDDAPERGVVLENEHGDPLRSGHRLPPWPPAHRPPEC